MSKLRLHLLRSVNGELLSSNKVVRFSSVVSESGIVFFTACIYAVKDVHVEIDAEIARSKELLSRQPPSHSRHFRADSDIKHAAAIRFYEDFSNLLVLSIKLEQRGNM